MADQPHMALQSGRLYLTDGGIETWLMYKKGFEIPHFCAFHLLNDEKGRAAIRLYYQKHAEVALNAGAAFIFDSLTYRASRDWGNLLGYSAEGLAEMNLQALDLYREVARAIGNDPATTLYSGCIGPKGDAYETHLPLGADEAEDYHAAQVQTFAHGGADFVTGLTLNSPAEAIGIARAAKAAGLPSVISFTLEEAGLVGGRMSLEAAINAVDDATDGAPAHYMVNCTHPADFSPSLSAAPWMARLSGLRANASTRDHGQLCQLGHLDEGDADDLARRHGAIAKAFPHINVYGGCCGTDHAHVEKICQEVREFVRAT